MRPKPTWHPYINRSDPLAEGLVGAWFALEGAGPTAHDLSGNGNHGTLQGAVSWVAGRDGPALDFPGGFGSDYVSILDGALLDAENDFTVVSLAFRDAGGNGVASLSQASTLDSNPLIYLEYAGTDTVNFRVRDDAGNLLTASFSSPATVDTWNSLAGVRTPSRLEVFLDGTSMNVTTGTFTSGFTFTDTWIGAAANFQLNLDGDIAFTLAYNRALPAASIRALHRDPTRLLRPVRRWWPVVEVTAAGITHPVIGSDVVGSPIIRSDVL